MLEGLCGERLDDDPNFRIIDVTAEESDQGAPVTSSE